jgi:hypothetical protein
MSIRVVDKAREATLVAACLTQDENMVAAVLTEVLADEDPGAMLHLAMACAKDTASFLVQSVGPEKALDLTRARVAELRAEAGE